MSSKLTAEERELVFNADWLRMKHRIMEKVMQLMGGMQDAISLLPAWEQWLEARPVLALGAKVSRGERYKDLPYVVLDYPRQFSRDDIFALRTMFWWGHDFTGTLHLAGYSLARYRARLIYRKDILAATGAHLYLPDDPWQHEIETGIYQPLSACTQAAWERALEREFFKLAKPFALGEWELMVTNAAAFYGSILEVLKAT